MIRKYIIDGNNLIGKIKDLWTLQIKDKQMSRVKLVKIIEQYFNGKKYKVSLHLDGYSADSIPSSNCVIHYSNKNSADSEIKKEIDLANTPKTIAIVSSDHSVQNYAKASSCTVISSEEFAKKIKGEKIKNSEDEIAKSISDDEMKKLFGI